MLKNPAFWAGKQKEDIYVGFFSGQKVLKENFVFMTCWRPLLGLVGVPTARAHNGAA